MYESALKNIIGTVVLCDITVWGLYAQSSESSYTVNIILETDPAVNEIKEYFVTDFRGTCSKGAGIPQSETLPYSKTLG